MAPLKVIITALRKELGWKRRCMILFASLVSVGMISPAQPDQRGYQIKAAFLFNFAQFVDWPSNAFPSATAPLVIGILGKDPFDTYLVETISGESINGHPLVVRRYTEARDAKACHILYVNLDNTDNIDAVLSYLQGNNILTVSDASRFTQRGGMIQFVTENNKIKMRINLNNAKAADLIISSKLLRLAEIRNN